MLIRTERQRKLAYHDLFEDELGISVVAKWTAKQELNTRSLVWLPLPGAKLKRTWSIAWLASCEPDMAEHTFIRLCEYASKRLDRD